MRRFSSGVLANVLVVVLAANAGAQSSAPAQGQYRPFTARILTTYFDEYGRDMRFYEWFFRKSDGSWARLRETEAFGERGTAQYIFDTGKRTMIRVDGFTRSAIVFRLPDEPVFRGYLEQPGTCKWLTDGTRKRLAESERLGLRVVEIAAGLDTKLWVAPELECFPLLELLIEDGVVRTKEEVLWLEFGEPDSNPFLIPSGFVEVSPLQFNELRKQRFQGRSDYREEELLQKLERDYQYGLSKSPGAK